jgi:hypothetical protein
METMPTIFRLTLLAVLCGALHTGALAQNPRGPSTAEERARLAAIVQAERKDPLGTTAANAAWFEQWMTDIPDYTLNGDAAARWCARSAKGDMREVVRFIYDSSAVAYQIEHHIAEAKTPAELAGVRMAGLEGVLAAYSTLLAKDPANRSPKMDTALARAAKGELAAFAAELDL